MTSGQDLTRYWPMTSKSWESLRIKIVGLYSVLLAPITLWLWSTSEQFISNTIFPILCAISANNSLPLWSRGQIRFMMQIIHLGNTITLENCRGKRQVPVLSSSNTLLLESKIPPCLPIPLWIALLVLSTLVVYY